MHQGEDIFSADTSPYLSEMRTRVSEILSSELQVPMTHRFMLNFGPFRIDMALDALDETAEGGDRRTCFVFDGPSAFQRNSATYTEARKVDHLLLSLVGWRVHRVRYDKFLEVSAEQQREYVRSCVLDRNKKARVLLE